jgi:hypothetical protein
LLLYVPPSARATVTAGLRADGLCPLAFGFDRAGATTASLPTETGVSAISMAGGTR